MAHIRIYSGCGCSTLVHASVKLAECAAQGSRMHVTAPPPSDSPYIHVAAGLSLAYIRACKQLEAAPVIPRKYLQLHIEHARTTATHLQARCSSTALQIQSPMYSAGLPTGSFNPVYSTAVDVLKSHHALINKNFDVTT